MGKFSLGPSFLGIRSYEGAMFASDVQRVCGHYESIIVRAQPGVFDRLMGERKHVCADCQRIIKDRTQLVTQPRLRIVCQYAVWGVERLMQDTVGIGWQVVAFLTSHEHCIQWIAATFGDVRYEIIEDAGLATI